jgi:ElaB/YqjD/DUF883 family membrane-anchored ribosome-binding protein
MDNVSSQKLMQDMQLVIGDAEDLLKATASQTGERIEKIRARAEESVRVARARVEDASRALDHQVHEHPWTAAAISAGVGLLVGLLVGRRHD